MSLVTEYRRQFRWRPWKLIFEEVPLERGDTVFDLGCGIGDQARELASRGCGVIALDGNQDLIDAATADIPPNCKFLACDLRKPPNLCITADGIWCSFTAAYIIDLVEFLKTWAQFLRGGGWIAITEIDNFFGHEPLSEDTRSLLQSFADDARAAGRYDFQMGSKLQNCLADAGFKVTKVLTLPDQELSFRGPAAPEIINAWRSRFQRMPGLRRFCPHELRRLRKSFSLVSLALITSQRQRSSPALPRRLAKSPVKWTASDSRVLSPIRLHRLLSIHNQ